MLATNLIATSFDSASLSGRASIAHPMREPGLWRLDVHGRRGLPVRSIDIIVRESGASHIAVEMAQEDSGCAPCESGDRFLGPGGMINLNATTTGESGYALLYGSRGREPAWDSRLLEPGDHYACMPLRPGAYAVSNLRGRGRSTITVNYPDPRALARGQRLATGPVYLQVGESITPGECRIDPGQVLAFKIDAQAHLVVDLTSADDGPQDLAEWKAARNREALNAAFQRSAR